MQIINQLGHIQHWGLTPAQNVVREEVEGGKVKVLLSGCSDLRHLLKTLSDMPRKYDLVQFYVHETSKEHLCRALLLIYVLHERRLNYDERMELYLDIFGNAFLKQRNAKYLQRVRKPLLDFIHDELPHSVLNHLFNLKYLKFEERDEMSEFIHSWGTQSAFDMQQSLENRQRYTFKERYDYRSNLVDWDYSMLLKTDIIHAYHYKEWRKRGVAFEQRFSTYTEPNRTLASYVPGRHKVEKTSCLVRGYWGDMIVSPYVAMGVECDYHQRDLLFKKANYKFIGHAVQVTEYNLMHWITMLAQDTIYHRIFRDYYRTDQHTRAQLDAKDTKHKKTPSTNNNNSNSKNKLHSKQIASIKEQQQSQQLQQNEQAQKKEAQINKQQQTTEIKEPMQKQQQSNCPTQQSDLKQNKKQKINTKNDIKEQELDSDEQRQRQIIEQKNSHEIQLENNIEPLFGFRRFNTKIYLMAMPSDKLISAKFKDTFDVVTLGFAHSIYLNRSIQTIVKKGGYLYVEKPTYLVPKRLQERQEITKKLQQFASKEFQLQQNSKDYLVYKK